MKEYYTILDVPMTATPEEIKAQYRQLVRIYHPDRFRDQDDKAYAEEKLKEINIAFQVLSGSSVRRKPFEARVAPQPVAYPPQLDFGALRVGQKGKQKVQIGNLGGSAETVNFVYSCENPWFHVARGQRVYANQPFPLDFEITVDTRRLTPGQRYTEWLEAVLDGIPVRVELQLQVLPQQGFSKIIRWRLLTAGLALFLLATVALSMIRIPHVNLDWAGPWLSARPIYELQHNQMIFSVAEDDRFVLYAGSGGEIPQNLGNAGPETVGTVAGQRIAYLDGKDATAQIHLFDLSNGNREQITFGTAKKSSLSWSADGLRLGYLVGNNDNRRIGIYDTRSGQEYLLPGEIAAGVEHFAWSPDGQSLLFDLWHGEEQRVYRMGVHGDEMRQLTHFDSWAGSWSGDGTQILVGSKQGLYSLSGAGQKLLQLTTVPATAFNWSANSEWIAYTTAAKSSSGNTAQTLWLMDRQGVDVQQLATDTLFHQWSPDGAILGYVTGNQTATEALYYLWTMKPGASPTLVAEINEPFFAWPR